jgi:hypothetical protein
LEAYATALRSQVEHPDEPCRNRIRIEAGHTVGKTKLAAGIVNHFFDCFPPAIVYTFAPSWEQIHDLLWKEIKADRRGRDLPGRILDLELKVSDNHFAKGRATSNNGGQGTERAQGQHGPYLLFVLDEAEGIDDYVWDAVDSMTSGGLSIVLMLANPRTRLSRFHKVASGGRVASFRIPCTHHPNVIAGREVVPGAVKRHYVDDMIDKHCEVVQEHSEDDQTFTVPWRPGLIYKPNAEFMFRVLGVAPVNITDDTFVPVGRYEAAKRREGAGDTGVAYFGVDVARYGKDYGTLYRRYAGVARRIKQFWKQDTTEYAETIKSEVYRLRALGVHRFHVRVDGGGGYGGGVIDQINNDTAFIRAVGAQNIIVSEVHFNGTPYDETAYDDMATEMYAATAELLKYIALSNPPDELEGDLCERKYRWVARKGVSVKRLEPKEDFRKPTRMGRSPDDGDGLALACAPEHLFARILPAPRRPTVSQRG